MRSSRADRRDANDSCNDRSARRPNPDDVVMENLAKACLKCRFRNFTHRTPIDFVGNGLDPFKLVNVLDEMLEKIPMEPHRLKVDTLRRRIEPRSAEHERAKDKAFGCYLVQDRHERMWPCVREPRTCRVGSYVRCAEVEKNVPRHWNRRSPA